MKHNAIRYAESRMRHRRQVLELLERASPERDWIWDREFEENKGRERYIGGREISANHQSTLPGVDELFVRSRVNVEIYVDRRGDVVHWAYANATFLSSKHALWAEYHLHDPRSALHHIGPSLDDIEGEGELAERLGKLIDLADSKLCLKIARDVRRRAEFLKQHHDEVLEMMGVPET